MDKPKVPQENLYLPSLNKDVLSQATFKTIYDELQAFGRLPDSFDLRLENVAFYDSVPEEAGGPETVVGKAYVINRHDNLNISERIEIGAIKEPGLPSDSTNDENSDESMMGYVSFQKDSPKGSFNGSILLLGSKKIVISAECFVKPEEGETDYEIWKFAAKLGTGRIWQNYAVRNSNERILLYHEADQRLGSSIARSLSSLYLASKE